MSTRKPQYRIIHRDPLTRTLTIRDIGPWDKYPTVTNGAEEVVADLVESGNLPEGWKLFCFDSDGQLDEIRVVDGKFAGFWPGPARAQAPGKDAMLPAAKALNDEIEDLRYVLGQIISDLPAHRDWLDPVLEKMAKMLIERRSLRS